MKRGSTIFLKSVVILIGLLSLTFVVVTLPEALTGYGDVYHPVLLGMYVSIIPFLFALYQAMKLLSYIDRSVAFSALSIRALRNIKYAALSISGWYVLISPLVYHAADTDDAPGVMALGLFVIGASFVIAIFAAVLEMLMQNAIAIKSENDLTV